jgi:hypothetical protein
MRLGYEAIMMSDVHTITDQITQLKLDEIKEIFDFIVKNYAPFPPEDTSHRSRKKRILGLHEHLGEAWLSDDFDAELPDEFWFGKE